LPVNGLTISSDERPLAEVFSSANIYAIPFFQRPYKWKPAKLAEFEKDLLSLADQEDEWHFMGAIILHERPTNPADANLFEVIDGQQRLTTTYLYIAAALAHLAKNGAAEEAARTFKKFLVNVDEIRAASNLTLHPSGQDRKALNAVVKEVLTVPAMAEQMSGFSFRPLPHPENNNSDRIEKNFSIAKRFFKSQLAEGGPERVQHVLDALLGRLTLVFIGVKDPLSGPKIFDSLNAGHEPMTVGDLVKNDIFSRAGVMADIHQLDHLNKHVWEPFYSAFGDPSNRLFDDYFFPYGLIHDPNVKKSDVYVRLRDAWRTADLSTQEVIEQLGRYRDEYLDLQTGSNRCELPPVDAKSYRRFYDMRAPVAIYPYLLQLCRSFRHGDIDSTEFKVAIDVIDSFLVRRAVCGIEPTGLKAVFQDMWKGPHSASPESIRASIAKHGTQDWPEDEEFTAKLSTRRLAASRVARYLLIEFDRSLGGDAPSYEHVWIEHVLPQNPGHGWTSFSSEDRKRDTDRLANLLILSASMNRTLQNSSYAIKQPVYLADSQYKSTRMFAGDHNDWTPEMVTARAAGLATWARSRWPYGPE